MNIVLKLRYWIIGFFGVLFIVCAILFNSVKVNYDNTKYLPESEPTKQALVVLDEEFGLNGSAQVMIKDVTVLEAANIAQQIKTINNINNVVFNAWDPHYFKDDQALLIVAFEENNYAKETKQALDDIRTLLKNEDFYLGGESVLVNRYSEVIQKEILKILAFIIPVIILVLLLSTSSWIDPLLFLIVVAVAVIINMGTNVMFPEISYMTHATCGILQLALCMDYSVMLMHSYQHFLKESENPKQAIVKAWKASLMPILGSALTTVTSFVVLMFMRYKIGFDIGIVLAKGTIISLIVSLVLLPCLLLVFAKLISKTMHKSIIKPSPKLVNFMMKRRWILPLIALLLIGASVYWQNKNTFIYGELAIAQDSSDEKTDQSIINETFGIRNQMVILIPKAESAKEPLLMTALLNDAATHQYEVSELLSVTMFDQTFTRAAFEVYLQNFGLDATMQANMLQIFDMMALEKAPQDSFSINEMITYVTTTNNLTINQKMQLAPFSAQIQAIKAQLVSAKYHRLLLTVDLPSEDEKTFSFVERLRTTLDETFTQATHIVGESVAITDMREVVKNDYRKVSLISMAFIFLIIAISFVSVSIPMVLVLIIEGAIIINMAIPAVFGQSLLYIGYIIVSCIQLGATIDYGILYASRYLHYRGDYDVKEATNYAYEDSKTTVLTSGLILICAGYLLGMVSSIPSIAIFGTLIGRGALISTLLVLFVLPQTLAMLDPFVKVTTYRKKRKS
ncbi:MAG TPA: MMPL family transporter [Bacilli bacterium]|nr:MAG: putative membrane protein YdgH [Tenericutes bacterium ADurb.BinA124]HPX84777.1 MMPL family transporter [Bacilli bacterium]